MFDSAITENELRAGLRIICADGPMGWYRLDRQLSTVLTRPINVVVLAETLASRGWIRVTGDSGEAAARYEVTGKGRVILGNP